MLYYFYSYCNYRAEKRLTEMKTTFPQTPCYLMKASALYDSISISLPPSSPTTSPTNSPPTQPTNTNSARTPDANVSVFLAEHLAKTVAPYIERQMAELNEIVCLFYLLFCPNIVNVLAYL